MTAPFAQKSIVLHAASEKVNWPTHNTVFPEVFPVLFYCGQNLRGLPI